MKDSLGDRMKSYYEDRFKDSLMRRMHTIIRVDGKAFHTYCKGLNTPFDDGLMEDMDFTAIQLCTEIMNAEMAFVQSDEISILMNDFKSVDTQAWYDNDKQKICSVSASIATASFNWARIKRAIDSSNDFQTYKKQAKFDSRVFQLPNQMETFNYFVWRQQDTTRNSISTVARSLYSHKELEGKSSSEKQDMIFQRGINWNDYAPRYKRGRVIVKRMGEHGRNKWVIEEPPIFTMEHDYLNSIISV